MDSSGRFAVVSKHDLERTRCRESLHTRRTPEVLPSATEAMLNGSRKVDWERLLRSLGSNYLRSLPSKRGRNQRRRRAFVDVRSDLDFLGSRHPDIRKSSQVICKDQLAFGHRRRCRTQPIRCTARTSQRPRQEPMSRISRSTTRLCTPRPRRRRRISRITLQRSPGSPPHQNFLLHQI